MAQLPGEDYPAQIKRLRARLGLTQSALAKVLGVSFPTINRWENGKARPSQLSWSQFLKLAGELDVNRVSEPEPPPYPAEPPILDFTAGPDGVRTLVEGKRAVGRTERWLQTGVTDLQGMHLLDNSSYWTKQRRELVRWLDDRAPSFTEGYVAAVRLLHTPSFPARVHLVCHVVRDIYRHLPATLGATSLPRAAEVFPDMVKNLTEKWNTFPQTENERSGRIGSDVAVSSQVHRCLVKLVEKSMELTDQPTVGKQLAIALFRSLDRRDDEFIYPWIISSFDGEYEFFVRRAHFARSLDRVPTDDGLMEHFEAFERGFHSLVGPYFSGKEELDAILQDTNTAAD